MKEGLKVKLRSTLLWASDRQEKKREKKREHRVLFFPLPLSELHPSVEYRCLSVCPMWSASVGRAAAPALCMRGYFKGPGMLRFDFWGEQDDTGALPNPLVRFVRRLMGSDMQPRLVFQRRPDPCLKCARQEEGRGKQTGGMAVKWRRLSPSSTSLRQFTPPITLQYLQCKVVLRSGCAVVALGEITHSNNRQTIFAF